MSSPPGDRGPFAADPIEALDPDVVLDDVAWEQSRDLSEGSE